MHAGLFRARSTVVTFASMPSPFAATVLQLSYFAGVAFADGCSQTVSSAVASPKNNIWHGLTSDETGDVLKFLYKQKDLNLTQPDVATSWDNSIGSIKLLPPNKTDALNYLDHDGPAPPRYAQVLLFIGAADEAAIHEIMVGPLPIEKATWQPLEYPFTRKTGGKIRTLAQDFDLYMSWAANMTAAVTDITMDLFGGFVNGSENDTMSISYPGLVQKENGRLIYFGTLYNNPTGNFASRDLLPSGLFLKADMTGRDPSKWEFLGWGYNDVLYPTTKAFREAWKSPGFIKLKTSTDGNWTSTDRSGDVLPRDEGMPPVKSAPGGPRYAVDQDGYYIEWMGFSFYIAFDYHRGNTLFDIRHKSERIIYELGLQESLSHYAGSNPYSGNMAPLDSSDRIGASQFSMVRGYDCPTYATYLNTSFYVYDEFRTRIDSICVFETEADYPMQRHWALEYVSATKNVYLTVRSISTIDNYEYMFDYKFLMDGSIRVEVRAAGYIMAAHYANSQGYGYRIHDGITGAIHHHVFQFKADFDILGTKNTVESTTLVPTTAYYGWNDGDPSNTMKLEQSFIETEDDGVLFWAPNSARYYRVLNLDERNEYGEYRGYKITPIAPVSHLTILNSTSLRNAGNFAKYDIAVTKQKDTEPWSIYPLNREDIRKPMIDFDKFFDGESLKQEDLVVWINIGLHHVPHTGDLPNTIFSSAHTGIQFTPSNYFHHDLTRATVNQIRLDVNASANGTVLGFDVFGQAQPNCTIDLEATRADLRQYRAYGVNVQLVPPANASSAG